MTEKEAYMKFVNCVNYEDLAGALDALKFISTEYLNTQEPVDDYDMLIQVAVTENPCALKALLMDGRCDWTHEENICGMQAREFAEPIPELKQLFDENRPPDFIFRKGEIIPKSEILDRIYGGTLELDRGIFLLYDEAVRESLIAAEKVTREQAEAWLKPAW